MGNGGVASTEFISVKTALIGSTSLLVILMGWLFLTFGEEIRQQSLDIANLQKSITEIQTTVNHINTLQINRTNQVEARLNRFDDRLENLRTTMREITFKKSPAQLTTP